MSEKNKLSNRLRSKFEQQTKCDLSQLKKEIEKTKIQKIPLSSIKINHFLKCCPNFIGCFPEDLLPQSIVSFPCFLIVNTDHSKMEGSHWIALGIFENRIEIFDPLGFQILNWPRIPCHLLSFLKSFSLYRKIIISKRLQSDTSILCGFYCIYYVVYREFLSWTNIQDSFSDTNDTTLIKFFK